MNKILSKHLLMPSYLKAVSSLIKVPVQASSLTDPETTGYLIEESKKFLEKPLISREFLGEGYESQLNQIFSRLADVQQGPMTLWISDSGVCGAFVLDDVAKFCAENVGMLDRTDPAVLLSQDGSSRVLIEKIDEFERIGVRVEVQGKAWSTILA